MRMARRLSSSLWSLSCLVFCLGLNCCGDGGTGGGGGSKNKGISSLTFISISCTPLDVQTTHKSRCTSNVQGTGTFSTSVSWSVTSGLGSIDASGLFTASSQPGVTSISAVSTQDATKSDTRTIIVSPHVTVDQPDDSQENQV